MNYLQAKITELMDVWGQTREFRSSTAYKRVLYENYKKEFISRFLSVLLCLFIVKIFSVWASLVPFALGGSTLGILVMGTALGQLLLYALQFLMRYHAVGAVAAVLGVIIIKAAKAAWIVPWNIVCRALRILTDILNKYVPWLVGDVMGYQVGEELWVLLYLYGIFVLLRCVYNLVQIIRYWVIVQGLKVGEGG